MGYVPIAASSCHQRYNQHAAFNLSKRPDLLTQQLDQTMEQIPHDWYQKQYSKRCVTTVTVPQPTAGYPVASKYNATTDYPVASSSHQQLI
ncbi:hypothetical protein F511_45562 [Dorcoceras hygrometricum]|uniref:Uncharacterized protein n=1 Tax=Dorcoceras hygrometricum TaxID=472368 RepID=A0A2Z7A2V2_9LAMI|nr:hypothetical protein F511_45562 [Dorcoceras hygrometricum]